MTSGERLKDAIERSGMTVTQVSVESGVSRSTINRMISTGDGMLYSWQAVALALGMRASELIGR